MRERKKGGGGRAGVGSRLSLDERRARKRTGWKVHIESKTQVYNIRRQYARTGASSRVLARSCVYKVTIVFTIFLPCVGSQLVARTLAISSRVCAYRNWNRRTFFSIFFC